jgi:hypothetical protein
MKERYAYVDTAKKLTALLLDAYSAMININTRVKITSLSHEVEELPLYDHHLQDIHTALPITDSAHPEYSGDMAERIQELEWTFMQEKSPPAWIDNHQNWLHPMQDSTENIVHGGML